MTNIAPLTDRAVLAVSGADRHAFLQGLITNDIRNVTADSAVFSAMLTPQGKYLFEFFILEQGDVLWLETDATRLPALQQKLTLYRLRSQVQFAALTDLKVAAMWGAGASPPAITTYRDPRHAALGWRIIGNALPPASGDYEAHRLALAIPEGGKDLVAERSLLLEYGYDRLNAVDFAKGCYVGQEVTARSKHRATLHKYVHQVSATLPLPPAGTIITSEGREVGEMRSAQGTTGLAMLRMEAVNSGKMLTAGEVNIRTQLPEWAEVSA